MLVCCHPTYSGRQCLPYRCVGASARVTIDRRKANTNQFCFSSPYTPFRACRSFCYGENGSAVPFPSRFFQSIYTIYGKQHASWHDNCTRHGAVRVTSHGIWHGDIHFHGAFGSYVPFVVRQAFSDSTFEHDIVHAVYASDIKRSRYVFSAKCTNCVRGRVIFWASPAPSMFRKSVFSGPACFRDNNERKAT